MYLVVINVFPVSFILIQIVTFFFFFCPFGSKEKYVPRCKQSERSHVFWKLPSLFRQVRETFTCIQDSSKNVNVWSWLLQHSHVLGWGALTPRLNCISRSRCSRNINGPDTPRPLTRPKLSLASSFSTNGLPDCPVGREPEAATGQREEPHVR